MPQTGARLLLKAFALLVLLWENSDFFPFHTHIKPATPEEAFFFVLFWCTT